MEPASPLFVDPYTGQVYYTQAMPMLYAMPPPLMTPFFTPQSAAIPMLGMGGVPLGLPLQPSPPLHASRSDSTLSEASTALYELSPEPRAASSMAKAVRTEQPAKAASTPSPPSSDDGMFKKPRRQHPYQRPPERPADRIAILAKHAQVSCQAIVPLCSRRTAASFVTRINQASGRPDDLRALVPDIFRGMATTLRKELDDLLAELTVMHDSAETDKLKCAIRSEYPALCTFSIKFKMS